MVKIITFITGNDKKLEEVRQILNADNTISNPIYILQAMKLDLPELQGEPEYIVSEKCRIASLQVGGPVIVEDTSLCFNALGSLPGPYIKWFEEKIGLDGLNNLLMAYEDKSAYAKCIFAYKEGIGSPIHIFTGITNGSIVPPRGLLKFGWDPIFLPDTFTETFAEMDSETKNAISHRYKALQLLKKCLN